MWIYDKQALVLVNESAKSFSDLWAMVEHITKTVKSKFDVQLVVEPEII
jgi:UDP-N-acetylenolpyruvoylglucosamine reductase